MRIDKYLWCVRLYKTRSIAQDALRLGRVRVAGQLVKASYELRIGERFTVRHPPFDFTYLVVALPKGRLGAALVANYLLNETPQETIEELRAIRASSSIVRDRGTGRPTKRDRRELLDFINSAGEEEWAEDEEELY